MGYEEEILDSFTNDDGEEYIDGDADEGEGKEDSGKDEDADGDEVDISDL